MEGLGRTLSGGASSPSPGEGRLWLRVEEETVWAKELAVVSGQPPPCASPVSSLVTLWERGGQRGTWSLATRSSQSVDTGCVCAAGVCCWQ